MTFEQRVRIEKGIQELKEIKRNLKKEGNTQGAQRANAVIEWIKENAR